MTHPVEQGAPSGEPHRDWERPPYGAKGDGIDMAGEDRLKGWVNQILMMIIASLIGIVGTMQHVRLSQIEAAVEGVRTEQAASNALTMSHLTDDSIHSPALRAHEARMDALEQRIDRLEGQR